jgi:hypothetical protein
VIRKPLRTKKMLTPIYNSLQNSVKKAPSLLGGIGKCEKNTRNAAIALKPVNAGI